MSGELGRRQRKDQPSVARVDGAEVEHIPEERPVRLRVSRKIIACTPVITALQA
jgi:hypothetical protein